MKHVGCCKRGCEIGRRRALTCGAVGMLGWWASTQAVRMGWARGRRMLMLGQAKGERCCCVDWASGEGSRGQQRGWREIPSEVLRRCGRGQMSRMQPKARGWQPRGQGFRAQLGTVVGTRRWMWGAGTCITTTSDWGSLSGRSPRGRRWCPWLRGGGGGWPNGGRGARWRCQSMAGVRMVTGRRRRRGCRVQRRPGCFVGSTPGAAGCTCGSGATARVMRERM